MSKKQSYNDFKKRVVYQLGKYKMEKFPEIPDGCYNSISLNYVLPKSNLKDNLMPGVFKNDDAIKYHRYANHLNSSQMMCINFFYPIRNDKILVKLLNRYLDLKLDDSTRIIKSEFEYTPDGQTRTNFDFYLELSNGMKFYMEIKYTENGFGSVSFDSNYPDRYEREWSKFYSYQVKNSMHLKDISSEDFYKNYQINRNLAYIKNDLDYVIFIYPFDNTALYDSNYQGKKLHQVEIKNFFQIDWHELCDMTQSITKGTKFYNHYLEFDEKYLSY
ncbi:PGN_0703 family putative restriction endonuclease [Acetoanaerobium noterae]|uniref:PGN_0703 family putative restriction endonuclease n=1 Tax=Acetoanaerobium noterae TaxID=745369 RepID=UPI0028A90238|nr:hypothetical protein [Acetoanaerobium noterae]